MRGASHLLIMTVAALALGACDGTSNRGVTPGQPSEGAKLPEFGAGSFAVVLGGDGEARSGNAFVAADGGAGIVLLSADSAEGARVVYRREAADAPWQRVPPVSDPPQLEARLQQPAERDDTPDPAALAGPLRAAIGDTVVAFELAGDGGLIPGAATGCTGEGGLQPGRQLGVAILAELTLEGCGAADGDYRGIAWVEGDAPNAAFRLLLEDGERLQDLYAFRF